MTNPKITSLNKAQIKQIVSELYNIGPSFFRFSQRWRSYICPFHILIDLVPRNAKVFDVGCGAGLFLAILAQRQQISSGVGIDYSEKAIKLANSMAKNLPDNHNIKFLYLNAHDPWPDNQPTFISVIDVFHHVDPKQQKALFKRIVDKVPLGGKLLYKDIARKPLWKALANRIHDLVLVREWINYVPIESIIQWGIEGGLQVTEQSHIEMLWYSHDYLVFERVNQVH